MSTSSREEFLHRVRRGLGRWGPTPPVTAERLLGSKADSSASRPELEGRTRQEFVGLIDRFEKELTQVQGKVARARSQRDLNGYLREVIPSLKAKKVVRWDTPLLAELDPLLEDLGVEVTVVGQDGGPPEPRGPWLERMARADLGITEADYAIADTGTLVLMAKGSQSRAVSLLPPVHLALVRPQVLVPSLAHVLPLLKTDNGRLSSAVTFITGPSRTADIETIRVVGIHGPMELHALVLEYL